jgi:tRNA(fMet)-specific endonuclease VapC
MKYLVDTDRVIDYWKGDKGAKAMLLSSAPDRVAISLITYGEIYEGIFFGNDPKRHEKDFLKFLR